VARSNPAQREYKAPPPGELVYDLEHPEPKLFWAKILIYGLSWLLGAALVLFSSPIIGLVVLAAPSAAMALEISWYRFLPRKA
jgi:hypothetical protein